MERKTMNTTEYIKIIKESPEKRKAYIFFGVTLIVVIALIVFAIRPTILTITKISKEIKEKQRVNTALEQKITVLSSLDKEYTEHKDGFNSLELIFPDDGNYSLLLSNIESIVSRNGYLLIGINFDEYKNENYDMTARYLMPWSLRVTIKGKVINLINLLKDIEALPMYPVIESVSYTSQVDKEGLTSFSINIRVYHIENNNFYD
jgi:Tfp pilus assembly protein PilO